ncbi:MAG: beta-galactosidase [Fimbriimonadaceae bacterium]|jgi:hypothetical protein|nr:beta-galactosidase [Fimbriimonadaceae bacterium]
MRDAKLLLRYALPSIGALAVVAAACSVGSDSNTAQQRVPAPTNKADMFPFVLPWDDAKKGTVTDMSSLNEKPAGSNGWIVARNGNFVYETSGKRVRMFGTNIGSRAAFPSKEDADKIAARLAKLGVNVIRFHHLNNGWDPEGSIWKKGRTFIEMDPAMLDRLDYFVAALKRNGIYSNINLQTARTYLPEMGFPESVREVPNFQKKLDKFNRKMIQMQKDYTKELLDRVNPYTKLKYRDDPAIAFIEINNENSLNGWPGEMPGTGITAWPEPFKSEFVGAWNQWLVKKYKTDESLSRAWPTVDTRKGASLISSANSWTHEQREADASFSEQPGTGSGAKANTFTAEVRNNPGPDWHVQVHVPGLTLKEGTEYTVSFRAKAEKPASVNVDSRLAKEDWRNLGLGASISLSPEFRQFHLTFKASNNPEPGQARIGFVLGAVRTKVTISDLELREGGFGMGLQPGESAVKGTVPLPSADVSQRYRDYVEFLVETETAFSEEMLAFLRNDLGFRKANIIDSQIAWGGLTAVKREAKMDFADNHAYWNHPTFLGSDWDPVNYRVDRRAMVNEMGKTDGELGGLAATRIFGKPYTVSEYNHPAPSDYQSEMMPLYSTFGAFQDWDILYTFAWDDTGTGVKNDMYENYFDMSRNPAKSAFFPATAAIFRNFGLEAGTARTALNLPATPWDAGFFHWQAWSKVGGRPNTLENVIGLQKGTGNAPTVAKTGNAKSPFLVTDGNGGQIFTADGPKVKAVVGFVGSGVINLSGFRAIFGKFEGEFAAMTVTAMDDQPLSKSGKILLTLVGRVENQDMGWNEARDSVSDKWGRGPVMAQFVPVTVSLATDRQRKAYALNPDGTRRIALPTTYSGGQTRFEVTKETKSLWIEIAP